MPFDSRGGGAYLTRLQSPTRLNDVAKPELGTKRVCPACATKYYDLKRSPITCPNCGTVFEPVVHHRSAPARAAPVVAAAEEDVEDVAVAEGDVDVVSLEEVEEDAAEADVGPEVDADEDEVVIPDADIDVDVDADIETADDPAFLEDEEEEGDDVAGLLDVEGGDEDEV
jgi:uncharacterized protein (TIGR02300 family)